jgi:hypothetical protein
MAQKLEYEIKGKSAVEQVTNRAKNSVDSLGASFKKAGEEISGRFAKMFSVVTLFDKAVGFVSDTFREFGQVADQVDRSGISSEQFQRLAYAAQQSGVSVSALAKATRQLRVDMAEAAAGNQKQLELFKAIGLSMEQIKAGDAVSAFLAISAALSDSASDSDRMLIATTFFGDKIGNDILPLLGEFKKLQKDIAEAPIVDEKTLKQIAEYDDKVSAIILKLKVFLTTLIKINEFLNPGPYGTDPITGKPIPPWKRKEMEEDKKKEEAAASEKKVKGSSLPIIEAIKKQSTKEREPKKEKEKAADTKSIEMTASSVSGNVIGVGQNPVISAISEQIELAKQQRDYLAIIASKGQPPNTTGDITNKGGTPDTPATKKP